MEQISRFGMVMARVMLAMVFPKNTAILGGLLFVASTPGQPPLGQVRR